MKVVYLCNDCKSTYFASSGKAGTCAKCGAGLAELDVSSDEWQAMSESERKQLIDPSDEEGLSIGSRKGTSKSVTNSMDIIVSLDNLNTPSIRIPIITKPLGGSAFENAVKYGEETKRGLSFFREYGIRLPQQGQNVKS